MGKLTASDPVSVLGDPKVTIAFPNWADIPSRILGFKVTYVNCTPLEQSFTFEHTRQVRLGSKVTKTKTLQTNTSVNAKIGFDFIVKGDSTISFSQTVGLNSAEEQNYEFTETIRYSNPVKAEAMGVTETNHWWVHRTVPVKFSGTVELDTAISSNAEGIRNLSAVFPSSADRVFDFAGVVDNSDLVEALTVPVYKKMTVAQCEGMKANGQVLVQREPYVQSCVGGKCTSVTPRTIQ
ncbi:hypothetical protein [Hydrogenophaga sp. 2FB]|uniref:hypothetical protein n=1 Tax=Hydrogenophaga sp. 2FB TaxID=2502187 RepID=UPI0010F683CC|nr:hypothetical protein [Hydrogenophaga sp. 2FB]